MDNIQENNGGRGIIFDIYDTLSAVSYSSVFVLLLAILFFRPVQVIGQSMEPTFYDMDRVVIKSFLYSPDHGDVVVVDTTGKETEYPHIIKRVIGCAGDTVDIDSITGTVYVNGEPIPEPYIKEPIAPHSVGHFSYPLVVEDGKVFVMGDNRNNSSDSRFANIGQVDVKYVTGKVIFRFFPLDRFGGEFGG